MSKPCRLGITHTIHIWHGKTPQKCHKKNSPFIVNITSPMDSYLSMILKFKHVKKIPKKGWQVVVFSLPCFGWEFVWWKHRRTELWGERRRPRLSWCVFSMWEPLDVGWRSVVSYFSMGLVVWGEVSFPHHPCIWYIYPLIYHQNQPNVGRYTSRMDHGSYVFWNVFFVLKFRSQEKFIWQKAMS